MRTLLFGLLLAAALAAAARPAQGPRWHDDLDEAFAEAGTSGRPLLLVFR